MSNFIAVYNLQKNVCKNQLRKLRREPRLKVGFIALFSLVFWISIFVLFFHSFKFLAFHIPHDFFALIFDYLFAVFFFALFLMITFSSTVIAFSVFFHAQETKFLMTCPISMGKLFSYKLVETFLFASWAVFFLGIPVCFAYGIQQQVSLLFYPLLILAFVPYITIPAIVGSLVTLFLTRFVVKWRRFIGIAFLLLLGLGIVHLGYSIATLRKEVPAFTTKWLFGILDYLNFARHPLFPSTWMSKAMLTLAHQDYPEFAFYLLLLFANMAFLGMVVYSFAEWGYTRAWSNIHSYDQRRNFWRLTWIPKIIGIFFFLHRRNRLFLQKDIKIFLRDPLQWGQFSILLGLLLLYTLNLRTLRYDQRVVFWKHIIANLNLTATALTICTFSSRFIFPMLSLEGKRFWTLGIMPIKRSGVIMSKFVFALVTLTITGETLVLISCYMLRLPSSLTFLHMMTMICITCGVAGLSAGLGAIYPNFREDSPAKIVSGFGGTLNLILNLLFVLIMVALQFIPSHLLLREVVHAEIFYFTILVSIIVTAVCCIVPLYLGILRFNQAEI